VARRIAVSRRGWFVALATTIAVLLAAELGVRAIADRLPPRLDWHTAEAQKKVAQMDALARRGGANVVFVGSSVVRNGAEPDVLSAALGVSAYNAGLTAGVPRLMEPWTLDVVIPRLRPKVLVIGVTSFDFSEAKVRSFYEAFRASPAARRAMGVDSVLDRVDRWLGDHVDLWGYRQTLRRPDAVLDALRGRPLPADPDVDETKDNGRDAAGEFRTFEQRTAGAAGLPVDNWSLGTDDPAALGRLIDGAKAQGIAVLLVDMPVTDDYVAKHPHGEADYATYLQALRALAHDAGVPLVELDAMRDHRYFMDEVHMNRAGAETFTGRLVAPVQALLSPN
jgi:hypothetical protein